MLEEDRDESKCNPFVLYLKEAAKASAEDASIHSISRDGTDFAICREMALKLAGDDDGLAEGILDGSVLLHEMPREYLEPGAADARLAWLRAEMGKVIEMRARAIPAELLFE